MNKNDLRQQITDAIQAAREYIEWYDKNASKNLGPFSHLADAQGRRFAQDTIAFQQARLEALEEMPADLLE